MAFSYYEYAIDGADTDCIGVCAIICLGLPAIFPLCCQMAGIVKAIMNSLKHCSVMSITYKIQFLV